MTQLPPELLRNEYDKSKFGIWGNLGKGANADILFIETVFSIDEIENITLISNIPGSEKWNVRDLFQRDVDADRVENDIIPYFKDETKIKYFSPITLILLPMAENKKEIVSDIEFLPRLDGDKSTFNYYYEKEKYYKINILNHSEPLAELKWNSQNCFLVAIDGQHRLSALRRWKKEPGGDIKDWKIPAVILNIIKYDKAKSTASLLELVRKTFVYINTKSERINKSREILLNDESVNAICTQELIQHSHENDIRPISERDDSTIPLIFFDWQGKVVNKKASPGAAAIKSIDEIYQWFEEYLFGEDGSEYQKRELNLNDLVPPLDSFNEDSVLSHEDAFRIRRQFNMIYQNGLLYLLENFTPYKNYISDCRKSEREQLRNSDTAQHAFMKLRFGTNDAPEEQKEAVVLEFNKLKSHFDDLKKKNIDWLIREDIGMRGVIYAFSELKSIVYDYLAPDFDFLDFSIKYTEALNQVYSENWFKDPKVEVSNKNKEMLTHLSFDEGDSITNYKLGQAKDGLGSFLVLIISAQLTSKKYFDFDNDKLEEIWANYSPNIKRSYYKGIKRVLNGQMRDQWNGSVKELHEKLEIDSDIEAEKKLKKFKKIIFKIN